MDSQKNPIILTDPFILEFFEKNFIFDHNRFIAHLIRDFEKKDYANDITSIGGGSAHQRMCRKILLINSYQEIQDEQEHAEYEAKCSSINL